MIQNIIVFIIVGLAALMAIKRIYKTVNKNRDGSGNCESCCSSDSCNASECE